MAQNQGSRVTRQRQVILNELRKSYDHLSADELYNIVRKQLPRVSLGTIYRNLDVLAEVGLIHKLEYGAIRRFDGNLTPHCHAHCLGCGKLIDLPQPAWLVEQTEQVNVPGFNITVVRLEYEGWCLDCTASSNSPKNNA